jgi:hypothetical protein
MRKVGALAVLAMLAATSLAEVTHGYVVGWGKLKRPDGTIVDITGMKFPYTAEPIEVDRRSKIRQGAPALEVVFEKAISEQHGPYAAPAFAIQNIYLADHKAAGHPGNYGILDPTYPSCSILDDITPLPGSIGKQWAQMTFGVYAPAGTEFLMRFTAFNSYTAGRGAGVSAVDPFPVPGDYRYDFGFYFDNNPSTSGQPWTYDTAQKLTVDISSAQVWAPTDTFWFAYQARKVQWVIPGLVINPDAPMNEDVQAIFSHSLPPQVGFSDVFFWLDGEPNGIYDEQEVDSFGTETQPSGGNLLLGFAVNSTGQVQDVPPGEVTVTNGAKKSGTLTSLFNIDSNYYVVAPSKNELMSPTIPIVRVVFTSNAPSDNVNSFSSKVTLKNSANGFPMKIEWYRYRGTPGWVQIGGDYVTDKNEITIFQAWTAGQLEQFIKPGDYEIKMRVSVFNHRPSVPYSLSLNKVNWTVGTP